MHRIAFALCAVAAVWRSFIFCNRSRNEGADTAAHNAEADKRDQGFLVDGAQEGCAVSEDQAKQGCGEVQGEVQEVPLHVVCI